MAMRRAVILGGTGVLGRATARRLLTAGWTVDLVGRDRARMPCDLESRGARFHAADRHDVGAVGRIVGGGADLLVDALCFTAADARQLVPMLRDVTSAVMLSSKAVYVDDEGRHVNSPSPPQFCSPIGENQPTVKPGNGDYNSRDGYGQNKVAAERTLLDSGFPVTVIRASKVHGERASLPLEWIFVKRIIDRRPAVFLAHRGIGGNHTTAAVNTAALIERVAAVPGPRILNSADPDAPNGLQIARTVAACLDYEWQEVLLDDDEVPGVVPGLGRHPWDARPPIVLDTSASLRLGYTPAGTYAETITEEIDWLLGAKHEGRSPAVDESYFAPFFNYPAEDAYLRWRY
jgi:nucleoside-diphosphate-sugar epimerase